MAEVTAPYPSKMDEIYDSSVLTAERLADRDVLVLKNRGGDDVATLRIRNAVENVSKAVRRIGSFDYPWQDIVVPGWYAAGRPNTKLSNPGTLPSAGVSHARWSPDGRYLAMGLANSPYFHVYKRAGDNLTKLTDPSNIPGSQINYVEWSQDGQYLLIYAISNGWSIYSRSGDTFTRVSYNSASFTPTAYLTMTALTSSGMYVAGGNWNPPYLTFYKRDTPTGTTFTLLTAPEQPASALFNNPKRNLQWSPDDTYLAVGTTAAPYLELYKRDGDMLSKLAAPPSAGGVVRSVSWTLDGNYLAVVLSTTPYLVIYKRDGDTLSKLSSNIAPGVSSAPVEVSWSPDGRYLAAVLSSTPYQAVWEFTYDEKLYKLPDLAALAAAGNSVEWSPDGVHLAFMCSSTPYIVWYKTANLPIRGAAVRIDADKPYPG